MITPENPHGIRFETTQENRTSRNLTYDRIPDVCPICNNGIDSRIIYGYRKNEKSRHTQVLFNVQGILATVYLSDIIKEVVRIIISQMLGQLISTIRNSQRKSFQFQNRSPQFLTKLARLKGEGYFKFVERDTGKL